MPLGRKYSLCILLVCAIVGSGQPPRDVPRKYLARRDFFNFLKSGEFSIMDPLEKELYYRIESNYHLLQRVEVIRYPDKKKTGRLSSKIHMLTYRGEFSVWDTKTNGWIDGKMEQNFQWFSNSFTVRWNGHQINMTNTPGDMTHRFRDENNELVADHRLQLSSVFWRKKYDMTIYSNKYPEEIYLLALAANDHTTSSKKNG